MKNLENATHTPSSETLIRQLCPELSSEYGKHWRQRLSVTIIRGRVMVVTAAVARERGRGNGEAPEEISAHSLG